MVVVIADTLQREISGLVLRTAMFIQLFRLVSDSNLSLEPEAKIHHE